MRAKLQEIRDRVNKATAGPWYGTCVLDSCGDRTEAFYVYNVPVPYSQKPVCYVCNSDEDINRNDAEFIANSPADINYLLDTLEQAQEETKKLQDSNKFFKTSYKQRLEVERDIAEMLGMEVDCGILERIVTEVKAMQDRERVLRDALEFYAHEDNYDESFTENENGYECDDEGPIYHDRGKIARVALGQEAK